MQRRVLCSNRSSVKLVEVVVAGFPTGVEKMGGGGALQNLMGEGWLKSIHGGAWGVLKCCQKIPVQEFI